MVFCFLRMTDVKDLRGNFGAEQEDPDVVTMDERRKKEEVIVVILFATNHEEIQQSSKASYSPWPCRNLVSIKSTTQIKQTTK